MTALVLLDHDGTTIKQPSRSAVAAARKLGEVHALVVGKGVQAAAEAAAKLGGVSKVIVADGEAYDHELAEPVAALIARLAPKAPIPSSARSMPGTHWPRCSPRMRRR
jgi:electron transfer flavoprotein alpha subunit